MKIHRKLAKLIRRETYRRAWRRAQRSIFRLPFGPVLAGLDQNRLRKIQTVYCSLPSAGHRFTVNLPNDLESPNVRLLRRRYEACVRIKASNLILGRLKRSAESLTIPVAVASLRVGRVAFYASTFFTEPWRQTCKSGVGF